MKKPIQEIIRGEGMPEINPGGYLEKKNGMICLRVADTVEYVSANRFKLTREWRQPPHGGWSRDIYEFREKGNL